MDNWDLEFEKTLADAEAILSDTARIAVGDAVFSLDNILA